MVVVVVAATFHIDFVRKYDFFINKELLLLLSRQDVGLQARPILNSVVSACFHASCRVELRELIRVKEG